MTDAEFRRAVLDLFPKLKLVAMARTKNGAMAEDLVQDVMVKIWSSPSQIIEAIDGVEITLEKYMKRMVVNRFYDIVRKEKRMVYDDDFAAHLEEVVSSDPTRRNLLLRDIARHLAKIGDECRSLLIDRAAGIKQQEMAEKKGITQSAVNKQIAKCLNKLNDSCGGIFYDA